MRLLLKPKDGNRDEVRGLVCWVAEEAAAPPLDSILDDEGVVAPVLVSLGLRPSHSCPVGPTWMCESPRWFLDSSA